ncbi:MAG: Pr6Pr family membrane protein [Micrococcales bacterium]|nr:Pr6Pr family membrane protein [Micrococcales bacterium]
MTHEAATRRSIAASRLVYGALAAVIALSFVIEFTLLFSGSAGANATDAESLSVAVRLERLVSYFTIDSNLIVLVVAILLIVRPLRDGPVWQVIWLDALLSIIVTGLVYAIVLAPLVQRTGWTLVETIGFHYVSPWLTLAAWLVFGPRQQLRWSTLAWVFVWPVAWLVYTFVHGALRGWYPYPFLDVTRLGYGPAIRNSLLVLVLAAVLGVIVIVLDRRLPSLLGPVRHVPASPAPGPLGSAPLGSAPLGSAPLAPDPLGSTPREPAPRRGARVIR